MVREKAVFWVEKLIAITGNHTGNKVDTLYSAAQMASYQDTIKVDMK